MNKWLRGTTDTLVLQWRVPPRLLVTSAEWKDAAAEPLGVVGDVALRAEVLLGRWRASWPNSELRVVVRSVTTTETVIAP